MKRIKALLLTQFFLYDQQKFELEDATGIVAPNGTGKSSSLDAIITILAGANRRHMPYNAQTDDSGQRTLREYCLGVIHQKLDDGSKVITQAREQALTYLAIHIHDSVADVWTTAGLCVAADEKLDTEDVLGRFVARGIKLELPDFVDPGEGGSAIPRQWEEFKEDLRQRVEAAGHRGSDAFQKGAEEFSKALLYQLVGPGVDHRRFLRTLSTAAKIHRIPSVDGFVKDFLLERKPINKESALSQITDLRKLLDLIATLEKKVARLAHLETKGERLVELESKHKAAQVLVEEFHLDRLVSEQTDCEELAEKSEKEHRTKSRERDVARLEVEQLSAQIADLERDLEQDADRRDHNKLKAQLAPQKQVADQARKALVSGIARVQRAMRRLGEAPGTEAHAGALTDANQALETGLKQLMSGGLIDSLEDALMRSYNLAERLDETLGCEVDRRQDRARGIAAEIAELKHQLEAGGLPLGRDTTMALSALREAGIDAEPACAGARITDRSWQGAIEAFLGRNRESLVVPAGEEDRAVDLLMNHPNWREMRRAKVLQREHLKEFRKSLPDNAVARLIEPVNPVDDAAARYFQALLGTMVCVNSVVGLREHPRSLMTNGAFSANFGTQPAPQALPEAHWLVGREATDQDAQVARHAIEQKTGELSGIRAELDRLEKARGLILGLDGRDELLATVRSDADALAGAAREADRLQAQLDAIDVSATEALEERLQALRGRRREGAEKVSALDGALGKLEERIEGAMARAREFEGKAEVQGQRVQEMRQSLAVDDMVIERVREALEADAEKRGMALDVETRDLVNSSAQKLQTSSNALLVEFRQYCEDFGLGMAEERYDWHLAYTFARDEGRKLRETTLIEKRSEVDKAREAAQEAFRSSVAVEIWAEVLEMRKAVNSLNRILDKSKPFTNGERYRFTWEYRREFKHIHDFVERAATSDGPLFMVDGQDDIIAMLEDLSDPRSEIKENPLDDYLLMFRFDVDILVGGKRIDRLSKRLGKGSGGEHKAPLYVILGAALHHAYQLNKYPDAAALMLIDEAFEKLDENNALAVSDFLRGLGLQVVAAASSANQHLIAMCVDRMYSLFRFGETHLDVDVVDCKSGIRALLTSDDPTINTELLDRMAAEYAD